MFAIPHPAAAVILCAASLSAVTGETSRYNQVSLHAEIGQQAAHDLMQVTLYSENQGSDPAKLAAETISALNAAIANMRKVKGVTISLGSRNSYPIYSDRGRKITGWCERAKLRLESSDFTTLGQFSADLLDKLRMGDVGFSIVDATRKKNKDQLMKGIMDAFKERAQLLTEALSGKGYKLVSLSVNSAGASRSYPMIRMATMKADASFDGTQAPEIEAGTSQVTINVNGMIEVQMPWSGRRAP